MPARPTSGIGFMRYMQRELVAHLPASVAVATETVSYNPSAEFGEVNPNGVWTYGSMTTTFVNFTPFPSYFPAPPYRRWRGAGTEPLIFMGNSGTGSLGLPDGMIGLHPGPTFNPCVLRFTAPTPFTSLSVNGRFLAGHTGQPAVAVRRNTTTLWHAINSGGFVLDLGAVGAGEYVDFCVYGAWDSTTTPLDVTITGERVTSD
jgi:hypothetical protein